MRDTFSQRVLAWWFEFGRKDLPWQREVSPYRVWVSEIMLQQTQVNTVIGYFDRFITRFPTLKTLAEAPLDDVLELWTGLGYYARARNLHRAAQVALAQYGGLPEDLEALSQMPGIGRSTAGAIMALGYGAHASILDGNVKRVLSRHAGVDGWPGMSAVSRRLWEIAESRTPQEQAGFYAQAMMDLGATLCTRLRPQCGRCPIADDCVAKCEARQSHWPSPKPRKVLPKRETRMLLLRDIDGSVLLERRPLNGLWGGLWSFPEVEDANDVNQYAFRLIGAQPEFWRKLRPVRHVFTHFCLYIHPLIGDVNRPACEGVKDNTKVWYKHEQSPPGGIPAPVIALLKQLEQSDLVHNEGKSL